MLKACIRLAGLFLGCAVFASALLAGQTGNGNGATREKRAVHILARRDWGAKAPLFAMTPHKPVRITIHHSATRQKKTISLARKMRNLQAFSQKRARLASGKMKKVWADIPYHYYIDWKGGIAAGRDPRYAGDTNTAYDTKGHILIVLEGNFEKIVPGKKQLLALENLAAELAGKWNIPPENIRTHRDYARTACPGKHLYARMDDVRRTVRELMKR